MKNEIVVPRFVDRFLEKYPKEDGHYISDILNDLLKSPNSLDEKVYKWVIRNKKKNENSLCMAWITGEYQIEEEVLYYVELFKNENGCIYLERNNDKVDLSEYKSSEYGKLNLSCYFTMGEIFDIDERYWEFATKVL